MIDWIQSTLPWVCLYSMMFIAANKHKGALDYGGVMLASGVMLIWFWAILATIKQVLFS
jgi:hypothetical protein